jgi:hypothetical protein
LLASVLLRARTGARALSNSALLRSSADMKPVLGSDGGMEVVRCWGLAGCGSCAGSAGPACGGCGALRASRAMGGAGSLTASPRTSVFGSEGGGSGTEDRAGRPANLSAPSGGRETVGRTSDGSGAGRGTGARDGRGALLALPGSAAALGSSEAVLAAGVVLEGAGSALRSLSSLTCPLAVHDTSQ